MFAGAFGRLVVAVIQGKMLTKIGASPLLLSAQQLKVQGSFALKNRYSSIKVAGLQGFFKKAFLKFCRVPKNLDIQAVMT